jgi:multipile epidermal growth factor-like domains protein 8
MSSNTPLEDVIIELEIEEESMNITCGENALYVYEGLPDLTGVVAPQKQLLSVYCNEDSTPLIIDTRSGALTIHYKLGATGQGFNAVYTVHSCTAGTCKLPYICDATNKKCTCPEGFSGTLCQLEKCPANCNGDTGQGFCEKKYGRCVCHQNFGGVDCSQKIEPYHLVFTELFNTQLLGDDNLEHLRKTLPRFGHTLVGDRRGSLWMFGGYSLSHGPLNDIRQFDTKNNTWMQVSFEEKISRTQLMFQNKTRFEV